MKNKLTRLLSALLLIALLASLLTVFAYASDSESTDTPNVATVFNRGFDDGWDTNNGGAFSGTALSSQTCVLGEEPTIFGVNRYLSMTVTSDAQGSCYYQLNIPSVKGADQTKYVMEFDIRSSGFSNSGNVSILYTRIDDQTPDVSILRKASDGSFRFIWGADAQGTANNVKISESMPEEWMHIALVFEADTSKGEIKAQCYADGVLVGEGTVKKETGLNPTFYRLQVQSKTGAIGDNVCFDNIKYYVGTTDVTELAGDDYGVNVDTTAPKTVDIGGGTSTDTTKTPAQCLNGAYVMKVGTKRALKAGERVNIFDGPLAGQYGEPTVIDGVIYLPLLPILDHMGYYYSLIGGKFVDVAIPSYDSASGAVTMTTISLPIGRSEAILNGELVELSGKLWNINTGLYYTDGGEQVEASYLVIPMDDIEKLFPGWYITYDDMGFIMLAEMDDLVNRERDLKSMADMMKKFVPDNPAAADVLAEMKEATNNFDHPYLYGTEDDFAFLRSIYNKEYLLENGAANTEFLSECGLTLENATLLNKVINEYVYKGSSYYVSYIVQDITVNGNPNHFFSSDGGKYSDATYTADRMYDKDGNFIFPYDDSVRGEGKTVFAPMFTQKTNTNPKIWDLVIDEYVIANAISNSTPKKDYKYNSTTGKYDYVGEGNGTFDYIAYDFVDLKEPEKNYKYEGGIYLRVTAGTGTHDLVDGEYVQLITPKNDYSRSNRLSGTGYNFAFPSTYYLNFDTDPADTATYLELNKENPTLCQLCGYDHFGYDCEGARQGCGDAEKAAWLAFAYWMTGEISYARLAYDVLDVVGSWQHWGSAHALNMAETAAAYALALDWIYDAVVEMSENGETNYKGEPMDIKVLQQHLWEHGVGEDYVMSVMKAKTAYLRDDVDTEGLAPTVSSYYVDDKNNWGNVCNGNTAIAAIALLSYTDLNTADTHFMQVYTAKGVNVPTGVSYQSLASEILELKFWCLAYYAAESYIPDGAYSESPGYWAYGTNEILDLVTVLLNTVGHSYGILDCPGYDKTFEYAASMETLLTGNKYVNFNYNDGGIGATNTSYFFTAGLALKEPGLVQIRLEQLAKNKSRSFADVFMFRDAVNFAGDSDGVELDTEYMSKNLGLFITRSSWDEATPLFAGMMGGTSSVNHGHLDNGSWVYYSRGNTWIVDIGSESYNVKADTDYPTTSDWNATTGKMKLHNRYRYYRLSSEGHNTLIITSRQTTLPYGQNAQRNVSSSIVQLDNGEYYYADENGSYIRYDMTNIYKALNGDAYAKSAYRGMLLTNSRKTLVIQDEVQFAALETVAWSAHISLGGWGPGKYEISKDGRTIYLYGNAICRMTIVTPDDKLNYGFEVRNTDPTTGNTKGVYLLDSTFAYDSHLQNGGVAQNDRSNIKNIVVIPKNKDGTVASVGSLKLAVVMETFSTVDEAKNSPLSYEYTAMPNWTTYGDGTVKDDVNVDTGVELRDKVTSQDINNVILPASTDIELMLMMNYKVYEISGIYTLLTNSKWSLKGLADNDLLEIYSGSVQVITDATTEYEAYVGAMNSKINIAVSIADLFVR